MRYSKDHNPRVRQRIVASAARALRARGLDGASIPALMKLAGLSHGAFYVHFADRDELVVDAVEHAANETAASVFGEDASLPAVLARYLSPAHAGSRERGCVVAALAAESAHQPAAIRHAFGRIGRGLIGLFQRALDPRRPSAAPSDAALVATSLAVGAVIMSRIVEDEALSIRLLEAARTAITEAA